MRTKTNPALFVLIYFDINFMIYTKKGKRFWKINNSISNDKYCRDMINDLIVKYSAKINKDMKKTCKLLWDAHKVEIREVTMTFSKIKAKESRELTKTLEKTLEDKLTYSDTAVIDNAIYLMRVP
jgi:ribosomal protein S3AE